MLENVGVLDRNERLSPYFALGGGVDYHIQARHFSVGLASDYTLYTAFDASQAVVVRLYLRYTK